VVGVKSKPLSLSVTLVHKTHLSISVAIKALMKGYKVLFAPVSEMLHILNAAKQTIPITRG